MSYAALAQQAGWTEGRVIRRVEALREAGILYFDVDLAIGLLGFNAPAYLWLIVEPAQLAAVGEEISRHAEVPFAAAITGSANLVTSVVCRDSEALYEYVTTKISAAAGVRQLEISPVLSRIKQAGSPDGRPAPRHPRQPRPALSDHPATADPSQPRPGTPGQAVTPFMITVNMGRWDDRY